MKSAKFEYQRPETLAAATELLADTARDVQILAGGQSLMPMMNLRVAQPDCLVDLNAVPGLDEIQVDGDKLLIGAMARYAALQQSSLIDHHLPLMSQAIAFIAHPAIRNRGTIGGSAALADPAAEMPAILTALDATMLLRSKSAARAVLASEFFFGLYETAREPDEILTGFEIPLAESRHYGFYEIARRHGDYASAGAVLSAKGTDPFDELRIVLFGVSDKPERLADLETALQDTKPKDDGFAKSISDALSSIDYAESMDLSTATRAHHANVALRRSFEQMCNRPAMASGKA